MSPAGKTEIYAEKKLYSHIIPIGFNLIMKWVGASISSILETRLQGKKKWKSNYTFCFDLLP